MLEYSVSPSRMDAHGNLAKAKDATTSLDTHIAGRINAFNTADMLLVATAACMKKGIKGAMPMIDFKLWGLDVGLPGMRQDNPPKMMSINHEPIVDANESDQRHDLLHRNVRTYGMVSNTIAAAATLYGTLWRKT
jgi:uncharacterized OsmC-like protein